MAGIEAGWGLDIILWFQSWRAPLIETFGLIFAALGSETFYLAVLPVIYWCVDAGLGRRLGSFVLLSGWSNSWFKFWWARPRPYMASERVIPASTDTATSYGIPSGHAQYSTSLWGAFAVEIKRRWVTILVVLYIILMGISRMVIGVHFPQDVIAGTLIGLAWVGLYAWLEPKFSLWIAKQSLWMQIGLVIVVTVVMLTIHPGLFPVTSPPTSGAPVPRADLLAGPVTPAAALLGLGIGFALESHFVRFSTAGPLWKRALRLLLGLAVMLGLRFGLGALFAGFEMPFVTRLVRYGIIGLWGGMGAPWVFVWLGLSKRRSDSGDSE